VTLDSSALIAILFGEVGHLDLVDRILSATGVRVAAPTLVETSMVFASRRKAAAANEVRALVHELGVTIVPFGERDWHAAVDAFLRFGRGRHKAALNFGDCLSYAAAATANDSLLFVGDDFAHTDITPA
jgi:ribonuclease VapC